MNFLCVEEEVLHSYFLCFTNQFCVVDGAVRRAAGVQIEKELRSIGYVKCGQCVITRGTNKSKTGGTTFSCEVLAREIPLSLFLPYCGHFYFYSAGAYVVYRLLFASEICYPRLWTIRT